MAKPKGRRFKDTTTYYQHLRRKAGYVRTQQIMSREKRQKPKKG